LAAAFGGANNGEEESCAEDVNALVPSQEPTIADAEKKVSDYFAGFLLRVAHWTYIMLQPRYFSPGLEGSIRLDFSVFLEEEVGLIVESTTQDYML